MSKGNLFLGSARGSVGDVTFSVNKGNQVTKRRNRQPANPRSTSQMVQRLTFSAAALFYKRSTQNLFKFAFEGKPTNQSDYNAFMAKNIRLAPTFSRLQIDQYSPAVAPWIMSEGSLPGIPQGINADGNLALEYTGTTPTTIGALSAGLMAANPWLLTGDILTVVKCYAGGSLADSVAEAIASEQWTIFGPEEAGSIGMIIKQVVIDPNDTRALPAQLIIASTDQTLALDPYCPIEGQEANSLAAKLCPFGMCAIVSRRAKGGLKVTSSQLVLSDKSLSGYNIGRNEEWKTWAAQNYVQITQYADNILEGSIAEQMP